RGRGGGRQPGVDGRPPAEPGRGDRAALTRAVGPRHGRFSRQRPLRWRRAAAMSKTEDRFAQTGDARGTDDKTGAPGNAACTNRSDGSDAPGSGQTPFAAYVPMGALSRYEKPTASVNPDTSLSWIKRAAPIVKSHKKQWFAAVIFAFVG